MSFLNSIVDKVAQVANPQATLVTHFTPPIKSANLPDNAGSVTIWASAFELHLTRQTVDELSGAAEFGIAVSGLVAGMVAASGGTLAVAAPFVVAFLTAEWAAIKFQVNDNGVK